ncbi:MAG: acyl carrier protein [Polyangia bacterium]
MWFSSKKSPAKSDFSAASPAEAEEPASGTVLDMLRTTVSRISRDHVPPESLDLRAPLLDSGYIDSLSATELLADIERRYGVRIGEMDIVGRLCTMEALAREIENRTGGSAK